MMQVVPSLAGSGAAVAAAATSFVFGQPSETIAPRASVHNRRGSLADTGDSLLPRPSTTSTAVDTATTNPHDPLQRPHEPLPGPLTSNPPGLSRPPLTIGTPAHPPTASPIASGRRQSFVRPADLSMRPIAENSRDSLSSNGSWMRRLSLRPLSQHGSPRSSVNQDSFSPVFSPGSFTHSPTDPQLPPNKLIKRASGHISTLGSSSRSRRGSKPQVPTFRRPATSHQRTATLRQFPDGFSTDPKGSHEQQHGGRPRASTTARDDTSPADFSRRVRRWTSFFHSRLVKAGRGGDSSPNGVSLPDRRIQAAAPPNTSRAYLVKSATVTTAAEFIEVPPTAPREPLEQQVPTKQPLEQQPTKQPLEQPSTKQQKSPPSKRSSKQSPPSKQPKQSPSKQSSPETTPRPKRSLSMHFSGPANWISKTGSLRRPKRTSADESRSEKRNVSGPAATTRQDEPTLRELFDAPNQRPNSQSGLPPSATYHPKTRKRNTSSPLPQLSRLSSFHIDVSDLPLPLPSSPYPPSLYGPKPPSIATFSHSQTSSSMPSQSRGVSAEHSSTMGSSDLETRDFPSGDDDDTDFKSDAVFDSFRTVASSRPRNVETPLESMFDESPPSTAGNSRTKRLSIQEILGHTWDGDTKITEEDEGLSTPVRRGGSRTGSAADQQQYGSIPSSSDSSLSSRGPSMEAEVDANEDDDDGDGDGDDDDDDDYWMRDEDRLSNHLSPPSSSVNSRKVNPFLRHALASMAEDGGEMITTRRSNLPPAERPRSNLFDWTETSYFDKLDVEGHSPRPKTVHGKQEMDLRGGRAANRKGPAAAHVRSQSVPVVPEQPSDGLKPAPKFGTWGLGTKPASEDWDDDFDFDEGEAALSSPLGGGDGAKDSATSFSMVVPASIQATQPTVRAHSGQIRELSLLVNDLKRLCRHGRDLDVLCGPYESKWREAQSIIELASPDEEEEEEDGDGFDSCDSPAADDERFLEEGFDASSLELEDPFMGGQEPDVAKSANTALCDKQAARRRSVFSPDDDIFGGGWPLADDENDDARPLPSTTSASGGHSTMISTVMEAMQQQRSTSDPVDRTSPAKAASQSQPQPRLFFDTNSLQELVKKAGQLRDSLSDVVRRAELLTQSPASTPRRDRVARLRDGSPAFTRVFTDPASSPSSQRLPKSRSNNSALGRTSIDSPRMQLMTVS